jgi:anti-sigma factor RsiW
MNCRDANLLLQLAEDGEITDSEHSELDAHLSDCLSCRRMNAWLDELSSGYPRVEALDCDVVEAAMLELSRAVVRTSDDRAQIVVLKREEKKSKRSWLGRIWTMYRSRRKRMQEKSEEPTGWKTNAAGSLVFGVSTIKPVLQPAVVGPSLATGWLRAAGSLGMSRRRAG